MTAKQLMRAADKLSGIICRLEAWQNANATRDADPTSWANHPKQDLMRLEQDIRERAASMRRE